MRLNKNSHEQMWCEIGQNTNTLQFALEAQLLL